MASDPSARNEGNLRFAGLPLAGYPTEPDRCGERVRETLRDQADVAVHGAISIFLPMPPYGHPSEWECQVGYAITGLARATGDLLVEDYRGLYALSLPHNGPIRDLESTHRRLVDHGRSLGHSVRPYWRVGLWRRRLADGNLLPQAQVSVFLDRW